MQWWGDVHCLHERVGYWWALIFQLSKIPLNSYFKNVKWKLLLLNVTSGEWWKQILKSQTNNGLKCILFSLLLSFINKSIISEPVRECIAVNSSLHGQIISHYPSCITIQIQHSTVQSQYSTLQQQSSTVQLQPSIVQLQPSAVLQPSISQPQSSTVELQPRIEEAKPSTIQYCTCNTDLCNGHLYDYTDTRVKRHRTRYHEDNFLFPFQESLDEHAVSQQRHIKCYSCGSLFNRDAPSCDKFDHQNETQRATCKPGEVCLLYQWSKNREEKGKLWCI